MNVKEIKRQFEQFSNSYDTERYQQVWAKQREVFREFWKTKIMGDDPTTPQIDYDPIIKLIDIRARGFNQETDEAIARVTLPQGTWYRIFNDLKKEKGIRTILDKVFETEDELVLVGLINDLNEANEKNKNGLTGDKAAALNALIFLSNPTKYLSCVSLGDRNQIIEKFALPNRNPYQTYGEKVIFSNRDIIQGFATKYQINAWPRLLSNFLYSSAVRYLWKGDQEEGSVAEEIIESETSSQFGLEKHFEDFLVANWEQTELGRKYDLIEEKGELVSQQYATDIGRIDLLVRDKKDGSYVVIELKKGQTSDDTVGQLTRYVGWVKENLPNGKPVKGIIIAQFEDERLRYALKAIPKAEFFVYKVNFSLEKR